MKKLISLSMACLTLAILMGCQSAVEQDFGNSVRQMQQAQQLHPELADNPPKEIVDENDGIRLEGATEVYRTENSTSERIREDIRIRVGQ